MISTIKQVKKLIRAQLIAQSGVNGQFVRDATTEYGAMLDKAGENSVFTSIVPTDIVILFDIEARNASSDMSQTNDDQNKTISYFKALSMHVMIYGDDSLDKAQTLVARFRTDRVRTSLFGEGIYLENVDDPTSIHEFKDDVVWLRSDFTINIACEFVINQAQSVDDYATVESLTIINKE